MCATFAAARAFDAWCIARVGRALRVARRLHVVLRGLCASRACPAHSARCVFLP